MRDFDIKGMMDHMEELINDTSPFSAAYKWMCMYRADVGYLLKKVAEYEREESKTIKKASKSTNR